MNTHQLAQNSPAGKLAKILQDAHNALVEAVELRSTDPYSYVAMKVFGVEFPTEEQRRFAKALCYRTLYEPREPMAFSTVLGTLETADVSDLELGIAAQMARQTCAA